MKYLSTLRQSTRFNLTIASPSHIHIPLGTPRERPAYVKKTNKVYHAPRSGKERQQKRDNGRKKDDDEEDGNPPDRGSSSNSGGGGDEGDGGNAVEDAVASQSVEPEHDDRGRELFRDVWSGFAGITVDERLREHKIDLEARHNNNWTMLMAATDAESYSAARKIVEKGAKLDWLEEIGQFSHLPMVTQRMKEIILPPFNSPAQAWPAKPHLFSRADSEEYLESIKRMFENGANVDEPAGDGSGWTSLFYAVFDGQLPLVELLISHGADINQIDSHGRSLLHVAARLGYLEISRLLIASGAEAKLYDDARATPLIRAAERGRIEIVELLLAMPSYDANTDLSLTDIYGTYVPELYPIIHLLLSPSENITATINTPLHPDGRTPLTIAVQQSNYNLVSCILDYGPDVNKPDHTLLTPLHYVADRGYL